MKKGVGQILSGIVLIVIQLMSVMGNIKAGTPLPSIQGTGLLMVYDLFHCFGFYLIGIVGILLLVIGKFRYEKSDSNFEGNVNNATEPVISKNPKPTILHCIAALLLFISLALAISTYTLAQKVNDLSVEINTLTAQMEEVKQKRQNFVVSDTAPPEFDIDEIINAANLYAYRKTSCHVRTASTNIKKHIDNTIPIKNPEKMREDLLKYAETLMHYSDFLSNYEALYKAD